jgi:16S rRNA (cytosine967-C5)-methyltransferase
MSRPNVPTSEPFADSVDLADTLDAAATAWLAFRGGASLADAIERAVLDAQRAGTVHPQLRAAVLDVATTAVRKLALIEAAVAELATRPPDAEVAALLAVALGQWFAARYPAHTLVDQTVRAAKSRAATRPAAGFVNALLRQAVRSGTELVATLSRDDVVRYNAPAWWLARLRTAYPGEWQNIAAVSSQPPPLTLRVNVRRLSCAAYLERLNALGIAASRVGASAVRLHEPVPVERVPGFASGEVSVQDAGAQLAAAWLDARPGQRVLDACAAPGGKTAHLLELADVHVDAVEADTQRAARIGATLQRLSLTSRTSRARVIVADAAAPAGWFSGAPYERILLDAPCTASGIVRRHPDIPWLRRPADVASLARAQSRLLDALWPLLAPAGRLLYVVCSVFPEEGASQIDGFVARHADAQLRPLAGRPPGALQLLPWAWTGPAALGTAFGAEFGTVSELPIEHDGFCYALIEKMR